MATLLLSFGIFALAALGLAVGLIAGRAPITGSCGGQSCGTGRGCAACPRRTGKTET